MKRELKKAITQLRKLQDKVFELAMQQRGERVLCIECYHFNTEELKSSWFYVSAHNNGCKTWTLDETDDAETLNETINEISNYLFN